MTELSTRIDHHAGRITLTRPQALNALNHAMVKDLTRALSDWRDDPKVTLVIIDAEGDRAFCAGGDIAAVYHAGKAGDHSLGQQFFADEYRMNAMILDYPKPIIAFMQGFVMGGGVGVGGHAEIRIVGDTTQMAMPETGIGLIPDVGGSWLLAHAPGQIGEYLGLTGARMGPGDAIHAGFADLYLPESEWPALIQQLAATGTTDHLQGKSAPAAELAQRDLSDFNHDTMPAILAALEAKGDTLALSALRRNSPLSMAATLRMIREARHDSRMQQALSREYRFTSRATRLGDFLEGVRAQLIDKDRSPKWAADDSAAHVDRLLAPLGDDELSWAE